MYCNSTPIPAAAAVGVFSFGVHGQVVPAWNRHSLLAFTSSTLLKTHRDHILRTAIHSGEQPDRKAKSNSGRRTGLRLLGLYGGSPTSQGCRDGDVRNRVAEIQSAIDLPRRVTLNRWAILETKEGWYVVSKRSEQCELISDAILRIDFAVPHRRLGTVYYQGRVLYKGEEVPFLERKDRVEKDTLNWMQNLLCQREVGAIMFNPDWTRRIVTIAGRFQETKLLEGVDTVGWNNERLCFVLPGYSIHLGGDVKPNEGAIFPEDVPGRQLEEPITLRGGAGFYGIPSSKGCRKIPPSRQPPHFLSGVYSTEGFGWRALPVGARFPSEDHLNKRRFRVTI